MNTNIYTNIDDCVSIIDAQNYSHLKYGIDTSSNQITITSDEIIIGNDDICLSKIIIGGKSVESMLNNRSDKITSVYLDIIIEDHKILMDEIKSLREEIKHLKKN